MNVIFLKKEGGIYGAAIRLWTWSPYIHAELEFSDGSRFTSSAGVGTSFLPPLPFTEASKWEKVPIVVTEAEETAMRLFCVEEQGCRYDWAGIALTQILGLGRQSKSKWFCSEVCVAALQHGLTSFPKKKPHWTSPKRLHRLLHTFIAKG
jgi:hypothetical protein